MRHLIFIVILFLSSFGLGQIKDEITMEKDLIKKTSYYEDGSIREVGYFDSKEKRHGIWTLYYRNGNRSSVASFKHGLKHGEWIIYDNNSTIVCRMFYSEGKKVGTWEIYKDGELAQTRTY